MERWCTSHFTFIICRVRPVPGRQRHFRWSIKNCLMQGKTASTCHLVARGVLSKVHPLSRSSLRDRNTKAADAMRFNISRIMIVPRDCPTVLSVVGWRIISSSLSKSQSSSSAYEIVCLCAIIWKEQVCENLVSERGPIHTKPCPCAAKECHSTQM